MSHPGIGPAGRRTETPIPARSAFRRRTPEFSGQGHLCDHARRSAIFLMVRDDSWEDMAGTPTMVVENFFEELRAKLKK
ncbi:MAG TPA: hypothetical protein VNJ04_18890 [Gemmatimonadaceae bacterium]|nr:hypothetical protein [Gemmatimonadaceae bacterium]